MVVYLSEVEVFKELIDGLKRSASSAHALSHYQQNPNWLKVRDNLEIMIVACQELVSAKSLPRQQVLEALDKRVVPKDLNGN